MCDRCDERFSQGTHVCLVFRDEAERQRVVASFVDDGLTHDQHVYYFADSATPHDVTRWLSALDVDLPEDESSLQFTTRNTAETYHPSGAFVPEEMYDILRATYDGCREEGFRGARVTGEMSWALQPIAGTERLMEYEAGVNEVLKTHPVTAMCQYDAHRFSGETIFQALRVHPYMIMNGQLVRNPYYAAAQ
ncbi:MAG: MEDS domain-containing protein [Alkalispirochaeta sp.]